MPRMPARQPAAPGADILDDPAVQAAFRHFCDAARAAGARLGRPEVTVAGGIISGAVGAVVETFGSGCLCRNCCDAAAGAVARIPDLPRTPPERMN